MVVITTSTWGHSYTPTYNVQQNGPHIVGKNHHGTQTERRNRGHGCENHIFRHIHTDLTTPLPCVWTTCPLAGSLPRSCTGWCVCDGDSKEAAAVFACRGLAKCDVASTPVGCGRNARNGQWLRKDRRSNILQVLNEPKLLSLSLYICIYTFLSGGSYAYH